ncbi:flagellar hook-length control protein FliK [Thalassotalea agariperforans]
MSQVTLLSLDITSSPESKGASSQLETDVNGQEHEFSKMFQRQVSAEENGKPPTEKAKSAEADNSSLKNAHAKHQPDNVISDQDKELSKTDADNNQQAAKAETSSSEQNIKLSANESVTTEDEAAAELLAQEQLNKQARVGAEIIALNDSAQTEAGVDKNEVKKAELKSESPIDFLTMLSASEKLLTEKVDASAINEEKTELKTVNAAHDASAQQVKKGSEKATELSELSQQIQQALNQSSNKTISSNDELAKQITGEPQNVSEKSVALEQTKNDESQAKVKISKTGDESFKLKPDVIQAEQTVSELKSINIDLPSGDKKQVAEVTATANKQVNKTQDPEQGASHIAAVAKSVEQMKNDSEAELSAQEKLAAMVGDKISSDNRSNDKNSSDKNIPQTKVVNNTVNSGEFTAAKHNDVKGSAEQITEQELNITSSEENKAVISQVVATATNATTTQSQETKKALHAAQAKTAAIEGLNNDDKSPVKPEVRIAESELLFDKTEQSMLANTVKSAQQFGLYRETSTSSYSINETSNAAQLEAITNKHVADNVQQVKNNQIQLAETIHIHRKDFVDSVKDKVLVMINQKLQQVDIKLDPPELGNVQVRVNLQGDAATVNFVVQNPQAKEALEQHMGKLREMLNESGVDVGEANVEQQNQQQGEFTEQEQRGESAGGLNPQNMVDDGVITTTLAKGSAVGVDFYA